MNYAKKLHLDPRVDIHKTFQYKFVKIFVSLGLSILSFSILKVLFLKQISLEVYITYIISSKKNLFLCEISSKIQVKVTKILRIWVKKFCEYGPWSLPNQT